jgi:hypothetical protein
MNEEVIYMPDNSYPQQSYAPPLAMPNDKADLLDKIKPDAIVETIRHKLLGEECVNGTWVKNPAIQNRALTETGAGDIANLMLGVSSQNVSLSKLNDHEIRERTLNIVKTAQYMCLKNWKEYGIKGADQLFFVHQIVMSNTLITLKQSEGEGIRKMIMGTISESRVQSENRENNSMLNLFRSNRR